jgi:hypothetical protein
MVSSRAEIRLFGARHWTRTPRRALRKVKSQSSGICDKAR